MNYNNVHVLIVLLKCHSVLRVILLVHELIKISYQSILSMTDLKLNLNDMALAVMFFHHLLSKVRVIEIQGPRELLFLEQIQLECKKSEYCLPGPIDIIISFHTKPNKKGINAQVTS